MALNPMQSMQEEDEPVDMSDPSDSDTQAMLDELDDAANAGDDFEAKASFEDVPGAEGSPDEEAGESSGVEDEEKLKAILAQLGG